MRDRSSKPKHSPGKIKPEKALAIVELRRRRLTHARIAASLAVSKSKASRHLLVVGSGTMRPLVAEMAKRFEAFHPRTRIEVRGGGSGRGIADIRAGRADLVAGVPIRLLPVSGVAASSKNIRRGNYPISRALTLTARETPGGLAKEFVNFALSAQVTDLVVKHDFVPYLD